MRGPAAALVAAALAALGAPASAADPARAAEPEKAAGPAAAPPAAGKPRLLLERLRSEHVAEALVEAVQERICAALADAGGGEVVCPSDVAAAARFAQQAALLRECGSDECLKRLDAVRRADLRVTGVLERGEGGLVLSLQLVTADGAGPIFVERLPEDLAALVDRVPVVVRRLFPAP